MLCAICDGDTINFGASGPGPAGVLDFELTSRGPWPETPADSPAPMLAKVYPLSFACLGCPGPVEFGYGSISAVPEPMPLTLLLLGLAAMGFARRGTQQKRAL